MRFLRRPKRARQASSPYWRMTVPEYDTDYDGFFINGVVDHPYGLPGIRCRSCNSTWGGGSTLPLLMPPALLSVPELNNGWPVDDEEFRRLRDRVRYELGAEVVASDLEPGTRLHPAFLDVPSTPRADILWPALTVIVSERVKPVFESLGHDVVRMMPVAYRRIGARKPRLPAPMPWSGDPYDLLQDQPLRASTSDLPQYYELHVVARSGLPPGVVEHEPCSTCGRVERSGPWERVVFDDMAPGTPMFHLGFSNIIVVTDTFRRRLLDVGATNVSFAPAGAPDAT